MPDPELEQLSILAWDRLRAVIPRFAEEDDIFLEEDDEDEMAVEGRDLLSWKDAIIALGEDLEEDELITELKKSTLVVPPSAAAQMLSAQSQEEAAAAMAFFGGSGTGDANIRRAGSAPMGGGWIESGSPTEGLVGSHSDPLTVAGGAAGLLSSQHQDQPAPDEDFTDMLVAPPAPTHDRSL